MELMNILFTKDQNDLFKRQRIENTEEIWIWRTVNIFVPSLIIITPLIISSFLPQSRISVQNLLLNGSFSLLGINVLFSVATHLINSSKLKDEKVETQIMQIRVRLIVYLSALLIFGSIFYVLQIAFQIDSYGKMITVGIGFLISSFFSIGISERTFLIRDDLVGKPFNDEINSGVERLTRSLDDLH
ncbi:MAG: hypothetical protein RIC30_15125 [Marinoscillum sp.]|uniref:hypothetical protein n=1 Tax=Marinoscillum sp. TaxID=2024838 RepID=UPI0032F95F94